MRVRHKDADANLITDPKMTIGHWQKEYLKNKKYLNYEFYDVQDIFDLYEVDKETGLSTYVKSDYKYALEYLVRKNDKKCFIKKHNSSNLNKYLMPTKSHFFKDRKIWYNLPKLKTTIESITNSTISKEVWIIIRGVFILLIAYTIWELLKTW